VNLGEVTYQGAIFPLICRKRRPPDGVPDCLRKKRHFADLTEILMVYRRIARHGKMRRIISTIAQDIHELYSTLGKYDTDAFHGCGEFKLPCNERVAEWLRDQRIVAPEPLGFPV
jgi:hypothetical protein